MIKNLEPYYWPLSRILEEHALIVAHTSKLSSGQRNAVKSIYEQKAHKGLLPGQKERMLSELEESHKAAEGAILELCRTLGMDPANVVLSNFTLVIDHPTGHEIMNYLLSFAGNFLGWIKVYKEGNQYKAVYSAKKD